MCLLLSTLCLTTSKAPTVIFKEQVEAREVPVEAVRRACRVYLKPTDFEGPWSFVFADCCPKCEHMMRYGGGRTSAAHSDRCRNRIILVLAKTPEGAGAGTALGGVGAGTALEGVGAGTALGGVGAAP